MERYKVFAIVGESGSGKRTLLQKLEETKKFNILINHTTRPMKEKEVNRVDYFFENNEDFAEQLLAGKFIEASIFDDYVYGVLWKQLSKDKVNLIILNSPDSIDNYINIQNIDLTVFYLKARPEIRLIRQLKEPKPNVDEIVRKYQVEKNNKFLYRQAIPYILENDNIKDLQDNFNFILSVESTTMVKNK